MSDQLDLDDDRAFQKRFWGIERSAWVVFVVLIMLALLGFSGSGGWFADRSISTSVGRLVVPQVTRWQTSDNLQLDVREAGVVLVEFDHAFLNLYELTLLTPEPLDAAATSYGVAFRYRPATGAILRWRIEPRRPSLGIKTRIRLNGAETELRAFVLP